MLTKLKRYATVHICQQLCLHSVAKSQCPTMRFFPSRRLYSSRQGAFSHWHCLSVLAELFKRYNTGDTVRPANVFNRSKRQVNFLPLLPFVFNWSSTRLISTITISHQIIFMLFEYVEFIFVWIASMQSGTTPFLIINPSSLILKILVLHNKLTKYVLQFFKCRISVHLKWFVSKLLGVCRYTSPISKIRKQKCFTAMAN